MAFTVQLPATITKKELRLLRRDDPLLQNPLKRPYPGSKKEKMSSSIFHSAEMLALADSAPSLI